MIFNSLHATAISAAEKIINAALAHDPGSFQRLTEVAHQVLLIDSTLPPVKVAVEPTAEGLILHPFWHDDADTTLSGPLVSIAALAATARERVSFADSGVRVTGDTELLRHFSSLLNELDVDWEGALARLIGDVPAHLLADATRKLVASQRETLLRTRSALTEIAQEELRLNPTASEFDDFSEQVRHLANEVDRTAARLNKLKAALESKIGENC